MKGQAKQTALGIAGADEIRLTFDGIVKLSTQIQKRLRQQHAVLEDADLARLIADEEPATAVPGMDQIGRCMQLVVTDGLQIQRWKGRRQLAGQDGQQEEGGGGFHGGKA